MVAADRPNRTCDLYYMTQQKRKKTFSFSLIERVILSAGAMLIFSVSFQIARIVSEDLNERERLHTPCGTRFQAELFADKIYIPLQNRADLLQKK